MTDRKNLKITPETYQLLKDAKDKHQTWDHFFQSEFGESNE